MRLQNLLAMSLALALAPGLVAAQKQSRAAAQSEGADVGSAALKSGPLNPGALSSSSTTPGQSNIWGSAYTGNADSKQTGKLTSPSLIGIGNEARTEARTSFSGYNADRDSQAQQATYFLDRNPVLKPTLSPSDPLFSTKAVKDSAGFASSTTKVCKQETRPSANVETMENSCIQTYEDYVVSCVSKPNVTITKTFCTPGQRQTINSSTGGVGDGFNGGDIFNIAWVCKGEALPDIFMETNGPRGGYNVTLPSVSGGTTEGVSGNTQQAAKFFNTTNCTDGNCTGNYTMLLGRIEKVYAYVPPGCRYDPGSQELVSIDSENYVDCSGGNASFLRWDFVERDFGKGSRFNVNSRFSTGKTEVSNIVTDDCAPYRALVE